jgi:hypothetical protein
MAQTKHPMKAQQSTPDITRRKQVEQEGEPISNQRLFSATTIQINSENLYAHFQSYTK